MRRLCYNFIFFFIINDISFGEQILQPLVETQLGQIEGSVGKTLSGRTIYSFEGIPYAVPPTGERRFQEAELITTPWVGVWKANTTYKCMQYDHSSASEQVYEVVGDEDCLYVNVFTPSTDRKAKMDVIVYIHGGAFMFTHGGLLGPEILLDRDVVYVKVNYRVGPLGFLSTEDELVPGNMGIKDQILALRWIKENIENFGGNPQSVTLIGMSAGGASVHLHYLTPKSKGLFTRGISQSGCALNPWVLMENPSDKTKKLASLVGCPTGDSIKMIDCLKKRPGRQIVRAVKNFQPWLYNPFLPFGVVVDGKWTVDPVLFDHPYNLLQDKKVTDLPWIVSFTSAEGLYPAADFYANDKYIKDIDLRWNELMPYILDYNYTVTPKSQNDVSEKIRKYYLKDIPLSRSNFLDFVQILSDRLFLTDIEKAAKLQAAATKSPVRSYYFTYRGTHSQSEYKALSSDNLGASHGDDTSYIFKIDLDMLTTEKDKQISKLLIDIVASYAKNGIPNAPSKWPQVSQNINEKKFTFIQIESPESVFATSDENLGNKNFWEKLPINENENMINGVLKDEL